MKKIWFLFIIISLTSINGYAQDEFKDKRLEDLKKFIEIVKTDNAEKICEYISFPLSRKNPLPPVKDKDDCISRYADIFDDKLKTAITTSNSDEDWGEVGWRGIMYERTDIYPVPGAMWFDGVAETSDAPLTGKITAINYQSDKEKELQKELIEKDRNSIYKSLSDFESNSVILDTDKFIIRIDNMNDWIAKRYASWSKPKTMADEPDIIISNGYKNFDGSGGNNYYIFKNGKYIYICYINVLSSSNSNPADITIYKVEQDIDIKNFDWADFEMITKEEIMEVGAEILRE
ncbi:MAG: hypothetical protein LBU68_00655 [Rickettsiales bacterium]|jgi:hypothetical protein|nr:hypothetical protein [Rickettsiales bacterium]